jgi:hypothetical protein
MTTKPLLHYIALRFLQLKTMKKLLLLLLLAAECTLAQNVIYVNHAAAGSNTGASWANAFTDLQLALEAAQPGNEIWVAQGTYYPSKDTGNVVTTVRRKFFVLVDSVGIYGGFTGTETTRKQRDWKTNVTTLSGDIGAKGDSTDNSFHVVYSEDGTLSKNTVLDGFTIRDGRANGLGTQREWTGGGLYIFGNTSAIFKNLLFTHNSSSSGGAFGMDGPVQGGKNGIGFCYVINSTFTKNYCASFGSGAYIHENRVRFINCAIFSNHIIGSNTKGAIYNLKSKLGLYNCTVADNTSSQVQGIRNADPVDFEATNCIISDVSNVIDLGPFNSVRFSHCLLNGSGGSANWQYSNAQDLGGNIDIWPNFVSLGNYRLKYISPARNAGLLSLLPFDSLDIDEDGITNEPFPIDLDGKSRLVGGQIDMGAYEYRSTAVDSLNVAICPGGQTAFNGLVLDSAGVYSRLVTTNSKGDSVQYLLLSIDSVNTGLSLGLFGASFISDEDSANYQWFDCSTNSILVGDTFQTFEPTVNGSYAVIIASKLGCVDTSECITINNVGLPEKLTEEGFTVYPNPATNLLHIASAKDFTQKAMNVFVYDLSGRVVLQQHCATTNGESKIDVSGLAEGVYVLEIEGVRRKFLKQ